MLGFNRWHLLIGAAAIFCISVICWLILHHFVPAPPSSITIATSFTGGHYQALGRRYQDILAREHVKVNVRATDGAVENLKLLNDPASGIQIAFMQGGVANGKQAPELLSLGRIDHQVFWLFYPTGETLNDLTQLKGKRIALGPPGSGTRAVTERILALSGVTSENSKFLTLSAQGAVNALNDGAIDALFLTFSPESPILKSLLKGPQYRPMSFTDAEALTRIFPFLVRLVMPRGVIDYERKIPATDVIIIATTNVVLVRKDIHPAIIDLLAQTMLEAHNEPGLFQKVGDFPTQTDPEFPVAQSARDFYKNGPSFLNRYLPFWMTNYAQRAIAVVAAVIAIALPLFHYFPILYKWNMRRRLLYWYDRLKSLEASIDGHSGDKQLAEKRAEIEQIDDAVSHIRFPRALADQLYNLRSHIDIVRRRLTPRTAFPTHAAAEYGDS